MSVRDAKFVDIPRLAELLVEAHQRSIYAAVASLEVVAVKQTFARALHRHGQHNEGATLALVSETDGVIEGFIIGLLDPVYPCLDKLRATDLWFIFSERADGRDAPKMLKQLMAWAEQSPKVIEVYLGVTSAIGDWARTSKLYERLGLEQCGAMFRREFDRSVEEEQPCRVS